MRVALAKVRCDSAEALDFFSSPRQVSNARLTAAADADFSARTLFHVRQEPLEIAKK
ncbi:MULTISPECIES: hypothetical protein [Cupriavidus]|uniref:hypothetical protein n=1 Tax=Cupriavidus TaxID=106589 RepID=UPI000A7F2D03|nr:MULTISPECIES: hypothetical protein [Cupriavidus]